MPRASVLKMFRTQVMGIAVGLVFLLFSSAEALAAAAQDSNQAEPARGRIVYMVVPEKSHETFWSNPPEFEAAGPLDPRWFTPQTTMLYWIRVYPGAVGQWELQDCILLLEPAFMHFVLNWVSPEIPGMGLSRGSDVSSEQMTGGLCHGFSPEIPYFEFTLDVRTRAFLAFE